MSFRQLKKSIKSAVSGLIYVFKNEQNFRIQVAVAIFVVIGLLALPLNKVEILIILSIIFAVLVMEILNTAIEKFADLLKPRLHFYVKSVKDIMAGATLLVSLCAMLIGLIVFLPYLVVLFKKVLF
jgi:diacylglycerol kinase